MRWISRWRRRGSALSCLAECPRDTPWFRSRLNHNNNPKGSFGFIYDVPDQTVGRSRHFVICYGHDTSACRMRRKNRGESMQEFISPGTVVLFGSAAASPAGVPVYEAILRRMGRSISPRIAILETPAGFEPNSPQVAGRIAAFLRRRLAHFSPLVELVPARKRGTPFSPDDPSLLEGILRADLNFLGPGSPTYAVRQLRGSRVWHAVTA